MNNCVLKNIFNSNKLHCRLYRFSTLKIDKKLNLKKQFDRDVLIIQMHLPKDYITYKFYCKRFVFNNPQITVLARKVAYIFAMLTLRLNLEGQLILVENQDEIQVKWGKTKSDLQRNHKGNLFNDYLKTIDSVVNNQQQLISFLTSNQMYGLLFKHLSLMDEKNANTYEVNEQENRKILTKITYNETCYEQLIFKQNDFIEGLIKEKNMQYELLWIG